MEPITIDPGLIGAAHWSELGQLLQSLWLSVLFVVSFASNMILGHITIPSFVTSGHIPAAWSKTRPVFYALAILSFALAMFFIYRATDFAGVLRGFWPDYWI